MQEGDVTTLLGHVGEGSGHVAADRVAGHGEARAVQALRGALGGDPLGGGVCLLDGDGVPGLGGTVVLHEDQGGPGSDGQLAHQAVVGAGVAEDPAATVDVEDHRQDIDAADGLHDAHAHVADAGGNGDPLVVHVSGLAVASAKSWAAGSRMMSLTACSSGGGEAEGLFTF